MPSLLPDECETIDATFWAIQCKRCIYVRSNSVVICRCLFCYLNPIIDSSFRILDSDKADIIYWYVGLNWTIVDSAIGEPSAYYPMDSNGLAVQNALAQSCVRPVVAPTREDNYADTGAS